MQKNDIVLAAKCAPQEDILKSIEMAGITAVELYTNYEYLKNIDDVLKICKKFPFRYIVHAPTKGYEPDLLIDFVKELGPEMLVFHDIYWENEWEYLSEQLNKLASRLCVENILSAIEPIKIMRRFGLSRCLDFEHLIIEVNGIFEEVMLDILKEARHIHMTGYTACSDKWHTPIHYSPDQSTYLLNCLVETNYSGFVVSEARTKYQTLDEFKAVNSFFTEWKKGVVLK